jgi:hypothetical protein
MLLGAAIGVGTSLLGGLIQSGVNRRTQRQLDRYRPEQVSTRGFDDLADRINGADFDRPLFNAFQNSQRGAAQQNQRIYAQQGNAALAADRTAADRRGAEGNLFEGVMANNMNRFGMLAGIQGQKSQVEMANVSANNQAKMQALNFRAQTSQNNPFVQGLTAAGGIAMNHFNTMGAERMFDNRRAQDMQFMSKMFRPSQRQQFPMGNAGASLVNPFQFGGPRRIADPNNPYG